MIVFDKVTKKFGEIVALDGISFGVEKGEFVFLTGPSGAGKSTLIRLLLGEYQPTSGRIFAKDQEISALPQKKLPLWRRNLGVIFQDYKLFLDRTVGENIALPLQISHTPPAEIEPKVRKVLNLVGLLDRENLFPAQLAGGEIQRTALARAIITGPEILLADEPTGNLDPKTSMEMMKLFQEINGRGTTILMATHNQEIVDNFKNRVIELQKGKLVRNEKEGRYHAK